MSQRNEKLRARLKDLEVDLLRALHQQFQIQATAGEWRDADAAFWLKDQEFLAFEKDILKLRRKLSEAIPGEPLSVVRQFRKSFHVLGTQQTGASWIALSKAALTQVEALIANL